MLSGRYLPLQAAKRGGSIREREREREKRTEQLSSQFSDPPFMKANATGRNSKSVREFLEKHYEDGLSGEDAVRLAVRALLEVVEGTSKNLDVVVMRSSDPCRLQFLPDDQVDALVKQIEQEKEELRNKPPK